MGLKTVSASGVCAADLDPCDLAAGHPSDPDRVGSGVETQKVVTHVAIRVCRAAIEREPDNPRFHYQLGRALFYWAGANDGDGSEGVQHIETAAGMGYRQAQFVLGYLHKLEDDLCRADARDTPQQFTPAPGVTFKIVGPDLNRHAAGHLAHRGKQRQCSVL